jgi:RimJ/RimL family protein N-acetyltransferase
MLRAELAGRQALATELPDVLVPETWPPELYDRDAVQFMLDLVSGDPRNIDWGFYYIALRPPHGEGTLVGAGGFKGAPDEEGAVEIGYSILPAYRRQGFASEAVAAWLRFAFDDSRVETVVAHTLKPLVASIRVLQKAGFRHAGSGNDPHAPAGEETVRYELTRKAFRQPHSTTVE